MAASIDVFELRLADAPGEIWYGVRVNGRSLEAGWADPEAARRRGEEYARELRGPRTTKGETVTASMRRGAIVEGETPDQPETLPVEPDEEDPGKSGEAPGHDPEGPGESENAPGQTKPEPKEGEDGEE